jgi:fructokinase
MSDYFAVIEAGGTKFNCAVVNAEREILAELRVDTTTPDVTLGEVVRFFKLQKEAGFNFERLGLACFGPLDLHFDSPSHGSITATPKPHWSNTAIVPLLEQALNCRVEFDTDVNAAALAEQRWGAAQGANVCIYVTVGTGVGGGVVINGKPLHGLIHPEIGHMLIPAPKGINGVCPFHGNCVEGLASGTAMGKIWQQAAETLPDDHQAWDIQAQVLGLMCHNLLMSFSPQKIILGGGVMSKPGLLDKVIHYTQQSLGNYLQKPKDISFEYIICLPGLDQRSGLFGALCLVH